MTRGRDWLGGQNTYYCASVHKGWHKGYHAYYRLVEVTVQTYRPIYAFVYYCLSINILLFILSYPFTFSNLSIYTLLFIHLHPAIRPFYPVDIQLLYPFIFLFIHWYPDIYPAVNLVFGCSSLQRRPAWLRPSLVYPAHQWAKLLCFHFLAPRCGHRRPPGQQRRRLRARRRSSTGSRRLQPRRVISAASAGPGTAINISTKNLCWYPLSWCIVPTCQSVFARYWVKYRNCANVFLTEMSTD